MDELFIWFNRTKLPAGNPEKNDFILKSIFNKEKPKDIPEQSWKLYSLSMGTHAKNEYIFPKELYMVILKKKYKSIDFDYYGYSDYIALVSNNFLEFMKINGLPDSYYEIAKLFIVNLEGDCLTSKTYWAIRFIKCDDSLIDFDLNTKKRAAGSRTFFLYPNLKIEEKTKEKKIYYLSQFCYNESLVFNQGIKNEIISNFKYYQIYRISDFPYIYNNQYKWDILPLNNEYVLP